MSEFLLPSLGADMTSGTLVAWKVKPGEVVTRGQVVAEVETDKGVIDVECFDPGTVERLVAEPGQKLPVGAVLAVIRSAGAGEPTMSVAAPSQAIGATVGVAGAVSAPATRRVKITPAARKRAAELGIDLERVQGSGIDGVIELADVEQSASATTPASAPPQPEDSRERMRRAIAAAMSKSKREIPHYYLETKIDMSRAFAWLEAENLKRSLSDRLLPAVLSLKAVALALHDVPELNGYWMDGHFQSAGGVHLGLAIAMKGGGLVAPAVHDADRKTLDELMGQLNDLIPRARAGRLRSSEMTDATATLTNLGDLGVETVFGVIYPPQVALVGLGKVSQQPWVENGSVCARPVLTATLSADHRATDGRVGGRFLDALNRRLQRPEEL
jgi:pyruvate dehydrogenase E2 component (dihydrolipoamide acetyltransferase)